MKYYKVNPEFDNMQIVKGRKIAGFLIANELYTEKELAKAMDGARLCGYGNKSRENVFIPVEISKNKTHWFCGARFQKPFDYLPF